MTTEGVMLSVRRMTETLDQVVDPERGLVSILPADINVITMWQEKADEKIRRDISTFYEMNKATLSNRDLLTLLVFADTQEDTLNKYGVDTSVVTELANELLKSYQVIIKKKMASWLEAIFDLFVKSEPNMQEGVGIITTWPEDVMSVVSGQIDLALDELRTGAKVIITSLVLNQIPTFISMKRDRFDSDVRRGTMKEETLCANINDNKRICALLREQGMSMTEKVSNLNIRGAKQEIEKQISTLEGMFLADAERGLGPLRDAVVRDFVDELRRTLLTPDWVIGAEKVADTMRVTLIDYNEDLCNWLRDETDLRDIIQAVVHAIYYTYVECILTFGISITPAIISRLESDIDLLRTSFREVSYLISDEEILRKSRPLMNILRGLKLDNRSLADFAVKELTLDFGCHGIKVWLCLMAIREISKDTIDSLYQQILRNWRPDSMPGAVFNILFVEKLRGPRSKKMYVPNS
jgi:hypothetical protein